MAGVLLRRAESDLRACRRLADESDMEDDVVGFHAQQAVEKAVKAVLILHGIDFPRSHDLDFLLARAEGHGFGVPDGNAAWLTPWAAQLRYDEAAAPLNRGGAIEAATQRGAVGAIAGRRVDGLETGGRVHIVPGPAACM